MKIAVLERKPLGVWKFSKIISSPAADSIERAIRWRDAACTTGGLVLPATVVSLPDEFSAKPTDTFTDTEVKETLYNLDHLPNPEFRAYFRKEAFQ